MFLGVYLAMDIRKVGRRAVGWSILSLEAYFLAIICFLSGNPFIGFLDLSVGVYDTILVGYILREYNLKKQKEKNKHKSKREQFLAEIMNNRK